MASMIPKKSKSVLEPASGSGNIIKAIELTGKKVSVTAPDDFFLLKDNRFDCVVMNPPFSLRFTNIKNAPTCTDMKGMKMGYYFLTECMKKSDCVIALMPCSQYRIQMCGLGF